MVHVEDAAPSEDGKAVDTENLDGELDKLDSIRLDLESLRDKISGQLDNVIDNSRRAPGLLTYISKQTENLVSLDQARIAAVKSRVDIKNKRFGQKAKLADMSSGGGGILDAAVLYKMVEDIRRGGEDAPREIVSVGVSDAEADAILEARRKALPPGVVDASRFLEPGVPGMNLEAVALSNGSMFVVDDDNRIQTDKECPDEIRVREGEKADIRQDEFGVATAWRDGEEIRIVRRAELKDPLAT